MKGLASYFTKRVVFAVVTIFIIISFNFFLFRILPGNPIELLYRNPMLTKAQIDALYHQFGLDKPLWEQFLIYIYNSLTGNLGISFYYKQPVTNVLIPALENSLILLVPATILSIALGIITGIVSAWHRGTKLDFALLGSALAFYTMPTFWLGSIFIIVALYIGGIPVSGMYSLGLNYTGIIPRIMDLLSHLMLPLITLTLVLYGEFTIIMRNSLIDVFTEDYIVTAKAKGADDKRIIWEHAYPNALLPMVSIIAINFGLVVAGAVLTETVFSWPGIGLMIYDAIISRDYPILQGAFLIISITVVIANLIADFVYSYLDPRIRYK
jgi:peptide/nickel transport system permease protein